MGIYKIDDADDVNINNSVGFGVGLAKKSSSSPPQYNNNRQEPIIVDVMEY